MSDIKAMEPPPHSSRRLRWALAVSVALNLAVAGAVAGAYLQHRPGGTGARDFGIGPIAEALRPQDRRALRRALMAAVPGMARVHAEGRSDLVALVAVLRSEPLEAARLRGVLAAQAERVGGHMAEARARLGDLLAELPTEERLALADRLEKLLERRGRR